MTEQTSGDLKSGALIYHRDPKPGKLEIQPTKPLGNQLFEGTNVTAINSFPLILANAW